MPCSYLPCVDESYLSGKMVDVYAFSDYENPDVIYNSMLYIAEYIHRLMDTTPDEFNGSFDDQEIELSTSVHAASNLYILRPDMIEVTRLYESVIMVILHVRFGVVLKNGKLVFTSINPATLRKCISSVANSELGHLIKPLVEEQVRRFTERM